MRKKLLALATISLFSNPILAKDTPEHLAPQATTEIKKSWSFSKWLSEGFQETMKRMETEFEKLKKEFAKIKLFGPQVKTWKDKDKKLYYIRVELPGYEKENISISLDTAKKKKKQILTITGFKKVIEKDPTGKKVEKEEEKFTWSETLPKGVRGKKADAELKDGVLEVKIPMEIKEEADKIEIKIR